MLNAPFNVPSISHTFSKVTIVLYDVVDNITSEKMILRITSGLTGYVTKLLYTTGFLRLLYVVDDWSRKSSNLKATFFQQITANNTTPPPFQCRTFRY